MAKARKDRLLTQGKVVDWLFTKMRQYATASGEPFDAERVRDAIRHHILDHLRKAKLPSTNIAGSYRVAESALWTWARVHYPRQTAGVAARIEAEIGGDDSAMITDHIESTTRFASLENAERAFHELQQANDQNTGKLEQSEKILEKVLEKREKVSATARKNARRPRPR